MTLRICMGCEVPVWGPTAEAIDVSPHDKMKWMKRSEAHRKGNEPLRPGGPDLLVTRLRVTVILGLPTMEPPNLLPVDHQPIPTEVEWPEEGWLEVSHLRKDRLLASAPLGRVSNTETAALVDLGYEVGDAVEVGRRIGSTKTNSYPLPWKGATSIRPGKLIRASAKGRPWQQAADGIGGVLRGGVATVWLVWIGMSILFKLSCSAVDVDVYSL